MSGAERSYRIALRAFPKQYREQRGEEIVSTILEGGDGWRPRLREFFGLLFAGVGQRSLRAGGEKTAGSVRAGIRLGAYSLLWLEANDATASLVHFHGYGRHGLVLSYGAAVIGVIVLLTLSRGWWAAPITLLLAWELGSAAFLGGSSRWLWHAGAGSVAHWTAVLLPALLCLLARPHKREPRDLRSPLWAIAAPALGALMGWQWSALYTNPLVGLVFVALLVGWLVLGWRDLRLSIALSTVAVYFGANLLAIGGTEGNRVGTFVVIELICLLIAVVTIAIGLAGRRVRA
jgi:hypothetical protein